MKKALVIGGNGFFGKDIVRNLLKNGHEVTLLNRGSRQDNFGEDVTRIKCDRNDHQLLEDSLNGKFFDVVFDQICFEYEKAKKLCEILEDKAKKIVFTSTVSVYDYGGNINEDIFNPSDYHFQKEVSVNDDYGEAKRQAEYAFSKFWKGDLVIIRLPIVLGTYDYTGRLKFHIEKVKKGESIFFPNINAKMSFVSSAFAGEVISTVGVGEFTGTLNVADIESITLKDFIKVIEAETGKEAILSKSESGDSSPYGISSDWFINCNKLRSLGFSRNEDWLAQLVKELS